MSMVRNGTSNNIGAALARLAALTGKSATIDAALPRSSQAPVVFIVGTALSRRADELKSQLSRLGGEIGIQREAVEVHSKGERCLLNIVIGQATLGQEEEHIPSGCERK
jgi:hypothetical protein